MLFYNALKSHGITRLALIPFVMIQRVLTIYVLYPKKKKKINQVTIVAQRNHLYKPI